MKITGKMMGCFLVFASHAQAAATLSLTPANAVHLTTPNPYPFTANFIGMTDQRVTWTLDWKLGTISSIGVYTPPKTLATPQSVALTATSVANPSLSSKTEIYLSAYAAPNVTVAPSGAAHLSSPAQFQFSSSIKGLSNTRVTWALDWKLGTVSSNGLYTPPTSVSTPQSVALTATLIANPNVSAKTEIYLAPYVAMPTTVFPPTPAQNQQILTVGASAVHPRLLWSSNPSGLISFIKNAVTAGTSTSKLPSYYSQLKTYADKIAAQAPISDPRPAGVSEEILWTARAAGEEITALGTMWKLTANTMYLNAGLAN